MAEILSLLKAEAIDQITADLEAAIKVQADQVALDAAQTSGDRAQTGADVTAAEAAKTNAETARDATLAATLAGGVYTDTTLAAAITAGLAAISEGETIYASGDDVDYIGLYRDDAGTAVELARFSKEARIDTLYVSLSQEATYARGTPLQTTSYIGSGTYVMADGFAFSGYLNEFRATVNTNNGTTVKIAAFDKSGDDFTISGLWKDVVLAAGANTITGLSIPVSEGQHLGISVSQDSRVCRTASVTNPDGGGYFNTGTVDATSFTDSSVLDTIQIEAGATVRRQAVTADRVLTNEATANNVATAFDIGASRNLYDRTTAQDGKTQNSGSPNVGDFAPRIFLGYLPVEPGKTYTLSIGHWIGLSPNQRFVCLTGQGSGYQGIDAANGVNTVAPNAPTGQIWNGDRSVTLTVPEGATYNFLAIDTGDWPSHTTDDFNAVLDTVIWEEAIGVTIFEPVVSDPKFARLKAENLPTVEGWDQVLFPTADKSVMQKLGTEIYVRSKWSDTLDLVEAFTIATSYDGSGVYPQFGGAKTVDAARGNIVDAFNDGTLLSSQGDDVGPMNYGGYAGTTDFSYYGGSHGIDDVRSVTSAAHGKDAADVGSVWTDGVYNFVLARIPDADTLRFLGENLRVAPTFEMAKPITGGTLTHVSGATNTGAITVTSENEVQLVPGAINDTLEVFVDGEPITADGYYIGERIDIRHQLELANPASIYDHLVANAGTAAALEINGDTIDPAVLRTVLYRWSGGGACVLHDAMTLCQPLEISHRFATQATKIEEPAGGYIAAYVPGTDPVPIGGGSFADVAAEYPLTVTTTNAIVVSDDYWVSPTAPPLMLAQIAKDGSNVRQFSHALGFVPDVGDAVDLETIATATVTFKSSSPPGTTGEDKAYLIGAAPSFNEATRRFDGATVAENSVYAATAYRGWTKIDDAAVRVEFWAELPDGRGLVVLDYAAAVTRRVVKVPRRWEGRNLTVTDASGLNVVSGPLVGVGGITVNSSGAARAVLLIG